MSEQLARCVLLADRHHGLTEGVRGLLETAFETVIMVADIPSLLRGAERLNPALTIVDVSLCQGGATTLAHQLRTRFPELKLLFLTVYDTPSIATSFLEAGAVGVVLKQEIATHLMTATEIILKGGRYVSPGIEMPDVAEWPNSNIVNPAKQQ